MNEGDRGNERGRENTHSKMSSSDPDLRRRQIGGGNSEASRARPETEKFLPVLTFIGALRGRRAIKNVDAPAPLSSVILRLSVGGAKEQGKDEGCDAREGKLFSRNGNYISIDGEMK